jgi:Uncharacterised nucleotidyltransferase
MSFAARQRLLVDALLLPLPLAEDAWRKWRASTEVGHLDHRSVHFLPALAGRMAQWLTHDPHQAIFLGICRRAWTQNQVRRKLLADALKILRNAGIERVAATGPVLWNALYWREGAIRPIGRIDLLVEPVDARRTLDALFNAGWMAPNAVPETSGKHFYFSPGALLRSPAAGDVRVHWRALPNTDFSLRRPLFPELELMPEMIAPYAIPAEHSLIAALGGNLEDEIDWRCDGVMICRQPGLRWEKVAALLRWRLKARSRLEELRRDWEAAIPPDVTKSRWTGGMERTLASALRMYRGHGRSS